MDQQPKQQIVEKLKASTNVLVTVSSSPSIDQLSAAIGMALMLNKLGKHATAVYSGETPDVIGFLHPEASLQKNTDSLQDFIISLDKSKADKLRYKVEDEVVKIFITPYKTTISEADLEFGQGDFNVDAVVAIGVDQRDHLDQAIVSHGRILHDATVITIMAGNEISNIGSINWQDPGASSVSEMLVSISEAFQSNLLDSQMATAFLTGIVAETDRFKNQKTTPKVMTMAAQLMAAGANQQLIADSLMPPAPEPQAPAEIYQPDQQTEESEAEPDTAEEQVKPEQIKSDPQELALPGSRVTSDGESLTLSLHDLPEADVDYGGDNPDNGLNQNQDRVAAEKIRIDDDGRLINQNPDAEEGEGLKDIPAIPSDQPPQPQESPAPTPAPAPEPQQPAPTPVETTPQQEQVAPNSNDPSYNSIGEPSPSKAEGGDSYIVDKKHKIIEPLTSTEKQAVISGEASQPPKLDDALNFQSSISNRAEKTLNDLDQAVGRYAEGTTALPSSPATSAPPVDQASIDAAKNAPPAPEPNPEPQQSPVVNDQSAPPLPPPPVIPEQQGNSGMSLPPVQ